VLRKLDGRPRITVLITATGRRLTCSKWNRNAVALLYKIAHRGAVTMDMLSRNFTAPARLSRLSQKRRLSGYPRFCRLPTP
jgi:hypothetical protein